MTDDWGPHRPHRPKEVHHGCLQDAEDLWRRTVCVDAISKNLRGELRLLDREREECEPLRCRTLKTDHMLLLDEVRSHEPCDTTVGRLLDGRLFVRRLVHALDGGTGEGRGPHTGDFRWVGDGVTVEGNVAGMTNVGTHREPVFDACQECHAPGSLEGRLCGRVVRARSKELIGCWVTAVYRMRFDSSEGFQTTGVEGTLEGVVLRPCGQQDCVELAALQEGPYPNPWQVGGHTVEVRDHTHAPTPSADVVTWDSHTGLNVSFETRVQLGTAAAGGVEVTLVHFSSPATVIGLDAHGTVVDSASMTGQGPETLSLTGPIDRLVIRAPQNETLLLRLCVD